jgi:hypothetical protein
MKAITTASKDPSANGSSAASPTSSGKSRGPRATIASARSRPTTSALGATLSRCGEQRSHPTAQIQNPPGLLKRELLEQPSGQAHQDRGPQVAIGLGLGTVVAGDAETGGWSSIGWWGRWHGGKGTLPRAPSVPPTPSHPAGWSTQALPGPQTRATQKQIHALRIGGCMFLPAT